MFLRVLKAASIALCAFAGSAQAQAWSFSGSVQYQTFSGSLSAPGLGFSLSCLGQYPGADPFYIEGDVVNDPYTFGLYVNVPGLPADDRVRGAPARTDLNLVVNGRSFPVAPAFTNEMLGAGLFSDISLVDPFMDTLARTGSGFELRAGTRPLGTVGDNGLTAGLQQFLSFCDGHWRALGQSPNSAQEAVLSAAATAAPPATPGTITPSTSTWTAGSTDTGGLIYGGVSAPEASIGFGCNAPSPGGRPLFETDDHETVLDGPFGMSMEVSPRLVQSQGAADVMANALLIVNGTGYRLPPIEWSDFISSWRVALRMDDPLFEALRGASDLVFDAGRGTAWRYPVDGLEQGINRAMGACVDGWSAAGEIIPVSLNRFWGEGLEEMPLEGGPTAPTLAPVSTPTPKSPIAPIANETPQFLLDRIAQDCNGSGYTLDAEAGVGAADFDGDGTLDYILSGSAVTCDVGLNPYCGASNCNVIALLSSRSFEDSGGFLGFGFTLATTPEGQSGFRRGDATSGPMEVWNGGEFVTRREDGFLEPTPLVTIRVNEICGPNTDLSADEALAWGDIDGDGRSDYVVAWRYVDCGNGTQRVACGGSTCPLSVFLSSNSFQENTDLFARVYGIVPLTNGRDGVGTAMTSHSFEVWGWDGAQFIDQTHLWEGNQ